MERLERVRILQVKTVSKTALIYPDQCEAILPVLQRFGIGTHNLGFFVLDNATNNDTTLLELSKALDFDPRERRLRCMGHIINLISRAYLYGQDTASFDSC